MSFSKITQDASLGQMNVQPMGTWYPAIEELTAEGDRNSSTSRGFSRCQSPSETRARKPLRKIRSRSAKARWGAT